MDILGFPSFEMPNSFILICASIHSSDLDSSMFRFPSLNFVKTDRKYFWSYSSIFSLVVIVSTILIGCCMHDRGGYWWLPTYSTWAPTIVSFSFPVSLIVVQFTIFGNFWVLNFRSHFEALNNVFLASNGWESMSSFRT